MLSKKPKKAITNLSHLKGMTLGSQKRMTSRYSRLSPPRPPKKGGR